MKKMIYDVKSPDLYAIFFRFIMLATVFFFLTEGRSGAEEKRPVRPVSWEEALSRVAEKYIGTPYRFGGKPRISGTADNSHLFYAIYDESLRMVGLPGASYMPMNAILANADLMPEYQVRAGDLIVLRDGHAALIYRIDADGKMFMIYASSKQESVISFNSRNVVFDAYWSKNLKGYYRLRSEAFSAAGKFTP